MDLQASDATCDIPVICMSGVFRGRRTARELQDAGAQAFLEKPFALEDLSSAIETALAAPARTPA